MTGGSLLPGCSAQGRPNLTAELQSRTTDEGHTHAGSHCCHVGWKTPARLLSPFGGQEKKAFLPGLHSWATRLRTSTAAGHCWMNSSQKELSSSSCAITKQALRETRGEETEEGEKKVKSLPPRGILALFAERSRREKEVSGDWEVYGL